MNKIKSKKLWINISLLVLIGVLIQIGSSYILEVVLNLVPVSSEVTGAYDATIDALTTIKPGMVVYVMIAAPLIEEAVFRLGLLGLGERFLPFWVANIVQAVLFGVYHGDLIQGSYAFLLGLIIGIVFEYLGRFYACLVLHSSINIAGLFLAPILPVLPYVQMTMIGCITFAIAAALIYLDYKLIDKI